MSRFILRYIGMGTKPNTDIERIHASSDVTVLDDSSPRMVLVEASGADLRALVDSMPEWVVAEERMIKLPDPHPRPKRSKGS